MKATELLRPLMDRSFIIRFISAIPTAIAISIIIKMIFGIKIQPPMGVLVGLMSYNLADWFISKGEARKAALERGKKIWGNIAEVAILFIMGSLSYDYAGTPTNPFVQQLYSSINSFGLLSAMFVAFFIPIVNSRISPQSEYSDLSWVFASSIKRAIRALAAYYSALFVVGKFGDSIYLAVQSDPSFFVIAAITAYACYAIFKLGGYQSGSVQEYSAVGVAQQAKPFSAEDRRYTAAHEAGHALVYAALGRLPPDAKIVINDHPNSDSRGYVRATVLDGRPLDRVMIEWNMLVLLAGKIGEIAIHGLSTLGSERDHQQWLWYARTYLCNHYQGVFFNEPKDSLEQASNVAKLDALQAKQTALLNTFFEMNAEVHQQLTDELLKVLTMDREAMIPFLSRVKLPDEFPRPFGLFEKFEPKWIDEK